MYNDIDRTRASIIDEIVNENFTTKQKHSRKPITVQNSPRISILKFVEEIIKSHKLELRWKEKQHFGTRLKLPTTMTWTFNKVYICETTQEHSNLLKQLFAM